VTVSYILRRPPAAESEERSRAELRSAIG